MAEVPPWVASFTEPCAHGWCSQIPQSGHERCEVCGWYYQSYQTPSESKIKSARAQFAAVEGYASWEDWTKAHGWTEP